MKLTNVLYSNSIAAWYFILCLCLDHLNMVMAPPISNIAPPMAQMIAIFNSQIY